MKEVDTVKLLEHARLAKATGKCSSVPLACMVKTICKKALCYKGENGKDFLGYSEDLKLDMYGNAVYAVYRAILENAELDDGDKLFNYLYTTALNSIRKTINRFYRDVGESICATKQIREQVVNYPNDAFMFNKRRAKGVFAMYEKNVFEVAAKRKLVRLQKVIRFAVEEFVENMNKREITRLINQARKIREAAC